MPGFAEPSFSPPQSSAGMTGVTGIQSGDVSRQKERGRRAVILELARESRGTKASTLGIDTTTRWFIAPRHSHATLLSVSVSQ